jgi:hypothetical protein
MFFNFKQKEIPKTKRPTLTLEHEIILHKLGHIGVTELTDDALNVMVRIKMAELYKKA